jgi:hypothetical protein
MRAVEFFLRTHRPDACILLNSYRTLSLESFRR